jgi:hypothetical protein
VKEIGFKEKRKEKKRRIEEMNWKTPKVKTNKLREII